ncbi:hypothetical protein MKX03_008963, partial [Papaver bracteatum]
MYRFPLDPFNGTNNQSSKFISISHSHEQRRWISTLQYKLEKPTSDTWTVGHFQTDIVRGVEGYTAAAYKQIER